MTTLPPRCRLSDKDPEPDVAALAIALHQGICVRWDGLCGGRSARQVKEALARRGWRLVPA